MSEKRLLFVSSAHTDVGLLRTANEDRFFVDDSLGLYVVADGMGGHRSGEEAAKRAIEGFVSALKDGRLLSEAAAAADYAVRTIEGNKGYAHGSPGSTLTAIILSAAGAQVAHVGDSEAWRMSKEGFEKITKDHGSWCGLANFCGLGTRDHGEQFFADVTGRAAEPGDRFLLASDGLTKHVREDEIERVLKAHPVGGIAEHLVCLCNERGGKDNITVIAVEVKEAA